MKRMFFGAAAAGYPDGFGVATMLGTCVWRESLTPLATDNRAFAPNGRPVTHVLAPSAGFHGVRKQHDSMTLIAATSGASGPLPDWDPV